MESRSNNERVSGFVAFLIFYLPIPKHTEHRPTREISHFRTVSSVHIPPTPAGPTALAWSTAMLMCGEYSGIPRS